MNPLRILALLAFGPIVSLAASPLSVSADFEGGSARDIAIDQTGRQISFKPGGDPARGWPCWWFFRVDGLTAGEEIAVTLIGSERPIPQKGGYEGKRLPANWATPKRAAVSPDGAAWRQTDLGKENPDGMTWRVKAEGPSLWLAWGPPFTPKDAAELAGRLAAAHSYVEAFSLTKSREGRAVPALRISAGDRPKAQRYGVWVQARQHAWESGASWVGRGLAEWLAGSDPAALWLREHAEVFVVPIMDVDHVATGDGGKEALPQDHNRDWSEAPHWPEVAAAQRRLAELVQEERLDVFLDLHNPGPADLGSYFYTGEDSLLTEVGRRNRERFYTLAREKFTGPIPYDARPRPSGAKYHPLWRQMSGNWVSVHSLPHTLSLCLETAWNTPASTVDGYRTTGAQLGAMVAAYLKSAPRAAHP